MNPEVKKIANKLFFSNQKIELGLIQDIDSSVGEASKVFQNSFELLQKAKKALSDSKTEYNLTISKYNESLKLAENTLSKVKELGLDVPEKQLQDKINNIKIQIKRAEQSIKDINSAMGI